MAKLSVRAVVFDLDGVLVDSEAVNVRSAFEAFEEAGFPLRDEDARQIVGRHPVDYVPVLARRFGLSEDEQRQLRGRQNEIYHRVWRDEARLTDGAAEVLADLDERGFPIALATSAGRKHALHCLERFRLREFFDVVLSKDDVSRRKPDPEIYLASARRLDLAPSATVVVEDSEFGVRAAIAAGARCVAVTTAHTPPDRIRGADAVIDSLRDLPHLLP